MRRPLAPRSSPPWLGHERTFSAKVQVTTEAATPPYAYHPEALGDHPAGA